jgi:hypothetical protein
MTMGHIAILAILAVFAIIIAFFVAVMVKANRDIRKQEPKKPKKDPPPPKVTCDQAMQYLVASLHATQLGP